MSRLLSLLTLACLLALPSQAQDARVMSLEHLGPTSDVITRLDARHRSAVHDDTTQAVFAGREGEVTEAWRALLQHFSEHLQAGGFQWETPLRGYYRFYFGAQGEVEHVLYRVSGLAEDNEARFAHLLGTFAETYTFGLEADERYAQCSPATLMPPRDAD